MKVTITKDGLEGEHVFDFVSRMPQEGDVYLFQKATGTIGGHVFQPGDTFELVEATFDAPWGYRCLPCSWRAKTKYDTSVWTSVFSMIQDGNIVLRGDPPRANRYDTLVHDPEPHP